MKIAEINGVFVAPLRFVRAVLQLHRDQKTLRCRWKGIVAIVV